jgi:hypothetical protein
VVTLPYISAQNIKVAVKEGWHSHKKEEAGTFWKQVLQNVARGVVDVHTCIHM